jgi:hypothetical protein
MGYASILRLVGVVAFRPLFVKNKRNEARAGRSRSRCFSSVLLASHRPAVLCCEVCIVCMQAMWLGVLTTIDSRYYPGEAAHEKRTLPLLVTVAMTINN